MPLLKPDFMLKNIFCITPQMLKQSGIKLLLLDVDNTLSIYHDNKPVSGVKEWIAQMKQSGISLYILSNAKPKRLTEFAKNVGLPYFYMSMKPLPFKMNRAIKSLGFSKGETAIVGDQLFTDILGGKLAGITTIWLEIIQPEQKLSFRIKRKIEQRYRRKLNKRQSETKESEPR